MSAPAERVKVCYEGTPVVLDRADPQPFIAAAGERYVATDGDMVLVRSADGSGSIQTARHGWVAVVLDEGGVVFATPDLVQPA